LQQECPNFAVYVNKWETLELSPTSPRCVYYEGVFDVYVNSRKVFDYVLKREKLRAKSYLDTEEYMFDPQMVTFKCRLYAHKDRKRLIQYLIRRKALARQAK
jgi:mannose-1-phosphate guanylyltransferase